MTTQDITGEIARRVAAEKLLRQLAEEATEVAQGALKVIRALEGEKHLNVTQESLKLNEEVGDVKACLDVIYWKELLSEAYTDLTAEAKLHRWIGRLDENEISKDVQ